MVPKIGTHGLEHLGQDWGGGVIVEVNAEHTEPASILHCGSESSRRFRFMANQFIPKERLLEHFYRVRTCGRASPCPDGRGGRRHMGRAYGRSMVASADRWGRIGW